jgi:hypothetical protein
LAGVRKAARESKELKFTALLHHVTVDLLRDSFRSLKRKAAPGGAGEFGNAIRGPLGSTVVPTADFGFMALITRWRTKSHTSNVYEKSLRKNCGGSSLARKGQSQSRSPHPAQRGSLQHYEQPGADDRNSAFWNTWVPCGRSAGITSHAVHLARTVDTTGAVTTWPS